jgi:hypothetical protein
MSTGVESGKGGIAQPAESVVPKSKQSASLTSKSMVVTSGLIARRSRRGFGRVSGPARSVCSVADLSG